MNTSQNFIFIFTCVYLSVLITVILIELIKIRRSRTREVEDEVIVVGKGTYSKLENK